MLFYSISLVKFIPYLIVLVLLFEVICRWRIFQKMQARPWLSIIPIVSDYVIFKKCWKVSPFVVLLILAIIFGLYVQIVGYIDIELPIPTFIKANFTILSLICFMAIVVLQNKHLAFAFGHDIGYVMGLLFLNPIFLGVMAFSKDTYHISVTVLIK